jgi:hypothetical protein
LQAEGGHREHSGFCNANNNAVLIDNKIKGRVLPNVQPLQKAGQARSRWQSGQKYFTIIVRITVN